MLYQRILFKGGIFFSTIPAAKHKNNAIGVNIMNFNTGYISQSLKNELKVTITKGWIIKTAYAAPESFLANVP